MAESRPLPCNFWSWPAVAPLLLEQKAILAYLWTSRFSTACGGFEFPVRLAAAELGLTDAVLSEALRQFHGLGLVVLDDATSEVFVVGWFRFHKFTTGPQIMNYVRSRDKIQSKKIHDCVVEASSAARVPQTIKKSDFSKKQEVTSQHQHQHQRQQKPDCLAAASSISLVTSSEFAPGVKHGKKVLKEMLR